jgi:two-component system OmpR family sensor kinase
MASVFSPTTPREAPRPPRRAHARLSLRWRLTLLFGMGFGVTLVVMFFTLHQLLINILLHDVDTELGSDAQQIASQVADESVLADPARLHDLISSGTVGGLVAGPSLTIVRDDHGQVVAQSSDVKVDELRLKRSEVAKLRRGETFERTFSIAGGGHLRVATAPIMIDGQLAGAVQTGESLQGLLTAGDRLELLLILEGAVGFVLAGVVGYVFVRRSLVSLNHVGAVAADIEANDLTRRLNLQGEPIEVQTLADTFDAMLERLQQSFEQQRAFVLDVSHELRTPLTALRGTIDVLLMDPNLPADVRAQLERISAETGRLIRLAANLLYLAQADTGKQGVMAPVELDLLCLEVVQQARALKPGVRLRLGDEDQVTVLGDRDLLKQLLLNLVENGLTYTPAGGQVTLSLSREGDHAAIRVTDTGVGIAPDDLPHIFERFYRAESGRRRAAGGAGVGLAIVDWVTRLHGGTIEVASELGKGSTFTVRLPLPPADTPTAGGPAAGDDEMAAPVRRQVATG